MDSDTAESQERAARLAVRLYDAREAVRTLLGEQYEGHMASWRLVIKGAMQRHQTSAIQAVLKIENEDRDVSPMSVLKLMAAAVDVSEGQ